MTPKNGVPAFDLLRILFRSFSLEGLEILTVEGEPSDAVVDRETRGFLLVMTSNLEPIIFTFFKLKKIPNLSNHQEKNKKTPEKSHDIW